MRANLTYLNLSQPFASRYENSLVPVDTETLLSTAHVDLILLSPGLMHVLEIRANVTI